MNIKQTYQNCDDTEMTNIQKQTKKIHNSENPRRTSSVKTITARCRLSHPNKT